MERPIPVITIGRCFGSGGRDVGQRLAQMLGFDYYDKELLSEAAQASGMSTEFIASADERAPGFLSTPWTSALNLSGSAFFVGAPSMQDDAVYHCQSNAIRLVARRGPCVIVGRTADHVLRTPDGDGGNEPPFRVLSVFVSAPQSDCARRIIARGECATEQQAIALMNKRNKQRAAYYNFYTDHIWGAAASYDLCVDTSLLGIDATATLIADVARQALGL